MPKTSRIEDISPQLSRRLGGWWWLGVKGAFLAKVPTTFREFPTLSSIAQKEMRHFQKYAEKRTKYAGEYERGEIFPSCWITRGGAGQKRKEEAGF